MEAIKEKVMHALGHDKSSDTTTTDTKHESGTGLSSTGKTGTDIEGGRDTTSTTTGSGSYGVPHDQGREANVSYGTAGGMGSKTGYGQPVEDMVPGQPTHPVSGSGIGQGQERYEQGQGLGQQGQSATTASRGSDWGSSSATRRMEEHLHGRERIEGTQREHVEPGQPMVAGQQQSSTGGNIYGRGEGQSSGESGARRAAWEAEHPGETYREHHAEKRAEGDTLGQRAERTAGVDQRAFQGQTGTAEYGTGGAGGYTAGDVRTGGTGMGGGSGIGGGRGVVGQEHLGRTHAGVGIVPQTVNVPGDVDLIGPDRVHHGSALEQQFATALAGSGVDITDPAELDFSKLDISQRERYGKHFGEERFGAAERDFHARRGGQGQSNIPSDINDVDFGTLSHHDRERYRRHFGESRFEQAEHSWHSRRGTQSQFPGDTMSSQAATGAIGFTDPNDIDFGNLSSQDRERYSNHFGRDRFGQAEQYWHSRRGTQYQGDNSGSTTTGTSAAGAGIGQGLGASPSVFGRPGQGGASDFGSGQGIQAGQGLRQGEYDTQRAGGSLGQSGQQNLGGRTSADSGYPASSSYQGQGQGGYQGRGASTATQAAGIPSERAQGHAQRQGQDDDDSLLGSGGGFDSMRGQRGPGEDLRQGASSERDTSRRQQGRAGGDYPSAGGTGGGYDQGQAPTDYQTPGRGFA